MVLRAMGYMIDQVKEKVCIVACTLFYIDLSLLKRLRLVGWSEVFWNKGVLTQKKLT